MRAAEESGTRRMSTFFNAENLKLRYEPFPIGQMMPMVDPAVYAEMVANWPKKGLFEFMPRLGNKYALSRNCNPARFAEVIRETPIWSRFDAWIRSPAFIAEVMQTLQAHHIDLGYREGVSIARQTWKNVLATLRGRSSHRGARFTGSWEFQMMPAMGGHILPHTDTPSKVVTMTLAIVGEKEWAPSIGGGIDVNRPKDPRLSYNQLNRQASFEEMDVLDTLEFRPNSGVIFIKTFNSWHSVQPMNSSDPELMRRNIIINIKSS